MSNIQMFEKPLGIRDSFPKVNEQKEYIRSTARDFIRNKGYDFIKTPTVEYFETIGKASAIDESSLFKLVDNQGEMLVLRLDMTTPIARIAASKLLKEKNPLRLAYYANVFRAQQREGGRPAEFEKGVDKICKKIWEESAEVIIASKNNEAEELKWEAANLIYHLLVLLQNQKVNFYDLLQVLQKRHDSKKQK